MQADEVAGKFDVLKERVRQLAGVVGAMAITLTDAFKEVAWVRAEHVMERERLNAVGKIGYLDNPAVLSNITSVMDRIPVVLDTVSHRVFSNGPAISTLSAINPRITQLEESVGFASRNRSENGVAALAASMDTYKGSIGVAVSSVMQNHFGNHSGMLAGSYRRLVNATYNADFPTETPLMAAPSPCPGAARRGAA